MESQDILILLAIIAAILGSSFIFYIIVGGFSKKIEAKPEAQPTPQPSVAQRTDERQKHIFPLKLQAYERIVLFIERIEPSSLVMRVKTKDMTSGQLHGAILNNIRDEYEQNIAQQIYISDNAWNLVKQAKEETIRIINLAAQSMEKDSTANDLTRDIFEKMMVLPKSPSEIALEYVKAEVKTIL